MEIIRDGCPNIVKREIPLINLESYNKEKIDEASHLLEDTISNYSISTFGLITKLREKYERSINDAYERLNDSSDYDMVKCNCYYLSKVLHNKLKDIDINSYFMTHKAHYYAMTSGDNIIKEAHISLIYPTIHNDKVLYTIFDSGLKVDKPLLFYKDEEMKTIRNDQLIIDVRKNRDEEYPYYINLEGVNPYSYNSNPHNVHQTFNPKYETLNIDDMLYPISYKLLTGYKATIFAKEQNKRAYITLYHLSKRLDFYDGEEDVQYSYTFSELRKIRRQELKSRLEKICLKLNLSIDEILDDIYFVVDIVDEFNNELMNQEVVNEYNKKMVKR